MAPISGRFDADFMKRFVWRIAAVSDIHAGSKYSLWHPDSKDELGTPYSMNEGQKKLFSYWEDFCRVADECDCNMVMVGGDVVHGPNPKQEGANLMSTSFNVQQDGAVDLLNMLTGARDSVFVSGSDYHVSAKAYEAEKTVCATLGGQWAGMIANMVLAPFNKKIHMSHGGGVLPTYLETAIGREIVFSRLAFANDKLPEFDMIIHGHLHRYNYMHQPEMHHLQLPGWTALEPVKLFAKSYMRAQPDIGGAIILIDEKGRITVWHFLYPLPHIFDSAITINLGDPNAEPLVLDEPGENITVTITEGGTSSCSAEELLTGAGQVKSFTP